jgi:hypothetical protein
MARDEAASLRQSVAHIRTRARKALYARWRRDGEPFRNATVGQLRLALQDIDRTCQRAQERWRGVDLNDEAEQEDQR